MGGNSFLSGCQSDIIALIGLLGSIASGIGLIYGYLQIKRMTKVTQASTEATNAAVTKLNREYSLAELARFNEMFNRARQYLYSGSYPMAEQLFRDIRFSTQEFIHIPQLNTFINISLTTRCLENLDKDIISLSHYSNGDIMGQETRDILFKHINDLAVHINDVKNKLKYNSPNAS